MESWTQSQWDKVLDIFGTDFNLRVYGTFLLSFVTYWGIGLIFTLVDYTGKPKFIMAYKVQENVKTYPINKDQLLDLIKVVLINQIAVIPVQILSHHFDLSRGVKFERELPSFFTALWHLTFFLVVNEIFFYYSHRLLHHPYVYKWIHKKHHTWISPVAISAAYCNPVEHLVSNAFPVMLGASILQSHTSLLWLYVFLATFETLTVHSGFHLPFLKSPEFHDFHHLKFNYNFGAMGLMDYLHGTDSLFRKSKQFQRHKHIWTVTPVKVLIP